MRYENGSRTAARGMARVTAMACLAWMTGCVFVDLEEGAEAIVVVRTPDEVAHCRETGRIGVSTRSSVGLFGRNADDVALELERLARNDAARSGASTIAPLGPIGEDGRREYGAYVCDEPTSSAQAAFPSSMGAGEEATLTARFAELESVQAFDELIATLGQLKGTILADARDEREASEGMRFILRTLVMSQTVTGEGSPLAPHFARMDTRRRKIGGDNPDGEYHNFVWDGRIPYRVTGNRGSVDHLSFTVLRALPNGRQKAIGYLNERDLELDANGDFTIWLTAEKPDAPGNWIETGPEAGAGTMLVRQYFGDRTKEVEATYAVSVVGRDRYDPLPGSEDAAIAAGIRGTIGAIRGIGWLHRYVSPSLGENPNAFKLSNSDDFGADISSIDNLYVIGHYDIAPDEALVIEVEPMDVRFWNLAIENPWHESVDYWDRRTSRTHEQVSVDPDGMIRFVVAHRVLDHPNALETAGHRRGFMTFRWVGERDTEAPLPRIVKTTAAEAIEVARARAAEGKSR